MPRVGQHRIHTPYMTVYCVMYLQNFQLTPRVGQHRIHTIFSLCLGLASTVYIHRIWPYIVMYLQNFQLMPRVGQHRIHTPYMTVFFVMYLQNILYTLRIYMYIYIHGSGQPYPCVMGHGQSFYQLRCGIQAWVLVKKTKNALTRIYTYDTESHLRAWH